MKQLKLYNWYGESFDALLPETVGNIKAYKKQVKNIYNRANDKIKAQEKIDKDLFLRARTKLQDNLKRELYSHKIAYKNKITVLQDSIKKLSYANSIESLLRFEIKKIKKQKKEVQKYAKDFVRSLENTADDLEYKLQSIQDLTSKTNFDETNLFKKFTIYNIILIYLTSIKNTDFNIELIKNKLLPIEIIWLNKLGDQASGFFKKIYDKLEKTRQSLLNKKNSLIDKYNSTYKLEKELYLKEKYNIELQTKQKILELEYEYNSNVALAKQKNIETKKQANQKIDEQAQELRSIEAKNKEKVDSIIANSNQEVVKIKQVYKVKKQEQKIKSLISVYKDLYNYLKYEKLMSDNIDFNLNLSLEELKQKLANLQETFKEFVSKNIDNYKVTNAFEVHLNWFNKQRAVKEGNLIVKSQYKELLGKSHKKYTYQGFYELEEAKALKDWFIDEKVTRQKFRNEKIQAKNQLSKLISQNQYEIEKQSFTKTKQEVLNNFKQEKQQLKEKLKNKTISKQAYKNKIIEIKIYKKEAINEAKLQSKIQSNKEILKTSWLREIAERKLNKKVYESKITEAQKSIPVECMKNLRWIAFFINLFLPGLSEILLFKQKLKGWIMLGITVFFWAVIIPFSFGFYWSQMEGVIGFRDLGARYHDFNRGIFPDARLYLFGGVISVILLVFAIVYFAVSAIGAYRVAKFLEYGSRPSSWTHTKRWLNTSGFPWVISLLGWVLMIFIVATPIITSVLISFTNYGYLHEAPQQSVNWVGLKQWGNWWTFRNNNLFKSLSRVISWTIIWTITSTLIPMSVGIMMAVLTNNQRIKFKKVFRIIYIIPWAIPAFVTLTFIRSMFAGGDQGLINLIFLKLGIISEAKNWLDSTNRARILVILVQTWIAYAWIFMLVTGNLQSISKDIYEAGAVDGAKGRQLFWHLTLPSLLLSIAPMLIGQFVGAFNNFTTISIFTGGGPAFAGETSAFGEQSTDIIISWVFKLTQGSVQFEGNRSFAAALTTLASLFSIGIGARGFIKSMSRRD
ncbi:ABC transporter permease subunit [Mycoplasma leonicaptivi]|uniref:ABC transporter permease subunit n=1 Tax=Mycoplasma leonicaptivi TaxID=36742 RepID=UPI0004854A85|nr:ABC transporter permease subunit [Mycoplasma leonicaptivi]